MKTLIYMKTTKISSYEEKIFYWRGTKCGTKDDIKTHLQHEEYKRIWRKTEGYIYLFKKDIEEVETKGYRQQILSPEDTDLNFILASFLLSVMILIIAATFRWDNYPDANRCKLLISTIVD